VTHADSTKLTASLLLSGLIISVVVEDSDPGDRATWTPPSSLPHCCYRVSFPLWLWRVVTRGDWGYLDTTKLTASLLLSGPLPSVVVEGSDPR
jgi:hypothetical protein